MGRMPREDYDMKRVLVTGGAGFIGSHLCDALLARGCKVMAFDCLMKQVHPDSPNWPEYDTADGKPWVEQEGLEIWFGDVRDRNALVGAMVKFQPDTIVHLAALVGVGQGDEQIANYTSANVTGTAVLMNSIVQYNRLSEERAEALEELAKPADPKPQEGETQAEADARYEAWRIHTEQQLQAMPEGKVERVFVAGSMSAYGADPYNDPDTGIHELIHLMPVSVYGWTKAAQEQLALLVGEAHNITVQVGRFFNVYGDRQALGNPYTGVGAIFAARSLAGLPARVYEDGEQTRDFIHVSDLVSGILTILDHGKPGEAYNVGTGHPTTIRWLAEEIAKELGGPPPEITGERRVGDVRHAYADASRLRSLGWEPRVTPEQGVKILCEWARKQTAPEVDLDAAHHDLQRAGLLTPGGDA